MKSSCVELYQKNEASTPVRAVPTPRVLSPECRKEINNLFPSKTWLMVLISLEVIRRWTWEADQWPVLSPWVPDPEINEEAEQRRREGRPRSGKTVHPPPADNLYLSSACVGWSLIEPQIQKIRPIVLSSTTPDELIERIEREVEIL